MHYGLRARFIICIYIFTIYIITPHVYGLCFTCYIYCHALCVMVHSLSIDTLSYVRITFYSLCFMLYIPTIVYSAMLVPAAVLLLAAEAVSWARVTTDSARAHLTAMRVRGAPGPSGGRTE